MLIILKMLILIAFFILGYLITFFIYRSILASRIRGEISVFEKLALKYKNSILEFNQKVGKLKYPDKYIPYIYLIIVNILGIISYFLTDAPLVWIFLIVMLYYFPDFVLNNMKRKRRNQIEKQLVAALIFLGNAMKAGLDLVQGLELSIDSLDAPISEEFAMVLHEYKLGSSLEDALINMRDRVNSSPVETFVTSIIIQRETGGDVTKIISKIVQTVRSTYKLQGKIQTLTAQGRVQALIVIMLPWVLGGLLLAIQPEFMLPMFRTTLGMFLLSILVMWQFIGMIVIKKIVTIEV